MANRHGRVIGAIVAGIALSVAVGLVVTDLQARARDRHEQADLAAAYRKLSGSRSDLAAASNAKKRAISRRNALQASVTLTLGQLASLEKALSIDQVDTAFQGASIGTLDSCLAGVESAYKQISAHNNALAADDLSASAVACSSSEGGASDGLVYPFDFPDPDVVLVGDTYFAYSTNAVAGNIQVIESTNLTSWNAVGNALPNLPAWATPNYTWAPAMIHVGDTYLLYFAAKVAGPGGGEECISVASATQPQGPFIDNSSSPLECQASMGGSIDPSPFVDTDGKLYLVWKSNGLAGPATIWSEQLNSIGTGFATNDSPAQLLVPNQAWEAGVVESPDMVTTGGHYFLFYSGNSWNSANYAVGVADCSGLLGPCTNPSSGPILASSTGMKGPGGESIFTDASGAYWIAFHAWIPGAVGYPHSRDLYVRRLNLSGATPVIDSAG